MTKFLNNQKAIPKKGSSGASSRRIGVTTAVLCLLLLAGTIAIAQAETYTFILKWGSFGNEYSGGGLFHAPSGIAVDIFGNVYVSDTYNCRIQKFSSTGVFLNKWGKWGYGSGDFRSPYGIAVDGSGNVYVADADNHIIQKFSSTGGYLGKWGSVGNGQGELHDPYCIAVDGSGNSVYVTEANRNRVQKFSSSGVFLSQISDGQEGQGDGQFKFPWGVAVDGLGNVYVAEWGNNRVQKLASNTQTVSTATGTGTAVFSSSAGAITSLTAVPEANLPTEGKPANVVFPHGLFSFTIAGLVPGQTVTVDIQLPSNVPIGSEYWKYQTGFGWFSIPIDSDNGDNVISITLTDGGVGDADGVANGVIVDPGGPLFVVPETPFGTTLVSVIAALVVFTTFKRISTKHQPT
jgi:DNA-binding beta-propeller fold protein YncE